MLNNLLNWLTAPLLESVPALLAYQWALEGLLVLALTLIVSLVSSALLDRIVPMIANLSETWNEVVIDTLRPPLSLLIWIVGLTHAFDIAVTSLDSIDQTVAQAVRAFAYIPLVAWTVIRFIERVEHRMVLGVAGKPGVDKMTADAVAKLLRLTVIVFTALILLQHLGVSVSGILAFGGVGGLAVGFAAKDLLANFFGGLMIYMDRPFKVGDWIRSPDQEIEGTVESIGWRLTRIRTFDKRPLYVPNSTFTNISVENPSRMHNRRIYETVGVRYDDAQVVESIVKGIKTMLKNHPEIDHTQTLIVNLNHFGPSSLDIMIYTFTCTIDWVKYHEVKQDILVKVMETIQLHGAEIAYPTSTLHLASMPEPG
jgi:MscS family membrane protein